MTALHVACDYENAKLIEFILDNLLTDASDVNATDNKNQTPL